MENSKIKMIVVGVLVFAVGYFIGGAVSSQGGLGATVYNRQISFDEGIAVDGTEVIDGDGAASFTTGAFSSTLTVTGETNLDSLIQGGDVTNIASATTTTLTAAQVCDSSVINFAANASEGVASTTLPTAASMIADCLTANGDSKTLIFRNTSVAASTTVLGVASTTLETLLYAASTTDSATIDGGNSALLTFIRTTATTTLTIFRELIDAD